MAQLNQTFTVACLFAAAAFAQTAEEELRSTITTVRYAPLAEQARIQGNVHLNLNGGVVTLLSGHPLLTHIAVESARAFAIQGQTNVDVTYHFVIIDTIKYVPTSTTIKKGNRFERAMLRVFGLNTQKVVHSYQCESGVAPANDVRVNGAGIEIWIYGRTFCLMPQTAVLAAKR